jgi:hydrogenase-4 component B
VSAWLTAYVIHRLASRALRRGPAWDCGYPNASPLSQYTASSFAQPIRRVFGAVAFDARETVTMPLPGDPAPARLDVTMRDPVWDAFYAPIRRGVEYASDKLNYLQFLTIRSYLSLVFVALVTLLLVVAIWP